MLGRLEAAGLLLKWEKCTFMEEEVEYLSCKINKEGLQPTADKVKAIQYTIEPQNLSELRSFLGLLAITASFCQIWHRC